MSYQEKKSVAFFLTQLLFLAAYLIAAGIGIALMIGMQIIFHFGLGVGTAFRQRDASEQEIDQELARRVGISRQAVIAIESGKYSPSLELAFRLALVFDKPIGEVFTCKSSGRETAEAESGTENK